MGNQVEYECSECDYYEYLHGIPFEDGEKRNIYCEKFRNKCCHCTKAYKMNGKGIYPPAEGGFKLEG